MTADYNFQNIRTLLTEGFGDAELRRFCFDHAEFREVYDQLSGNSGKSQIVQLLIEYADRQELFAPLLVWTKKQNPAKYKKHRPYSTSDDDPETSDSPPSSSDEPGYQPPQPMIEDSAELEHIRSLLDIKQRRLRVLEKQYETMRDLTPPHIVMEIDTLQAEIEQAQSQLGLRPMPSKNLTPDLDPQTSSSESKTYSNKEIFVSYAWGGESEKTVDQIEQAFQAKGITIIRDKQALGYKGRITEFMERLGRGKAVIAVISKKYLESEYCMFELVQIAKNDQFYDRIFPVVLEDANIYKPVQRLRYVKYWEDQIAELDEEMKSVSSANLQGFRESIDLYTEIRAMIAALTDTLKDMNTLTIDLHREADFKHLIDAVEQKMVE